MSLAREVAEAYIEVHGDMSPFRKELEQLTKQAHAEAIKAADDFADGWNKRVTAQTKGQWAGILDAYFSKSSVDWDRVIGKFDSKNLDDARNKMKAFVEEMNQAQKFGRKNAATYNGLMKEIDRVVNAKIRLRDASKALAEEQAHEENALRKMAETMADAMRENEKYNRSLDGMIKNLKRADLESDFKKIADAVAKADFSGFAKNFDTLDDLSARVREVTSAMEAQGRVSLDASMMAVGGVDQYVRSEEARLKAIQDALEATKLAREEAEKYKRSLDGMVEAAKIAQMERDFTSLSNAIASNDWSQIARGSKNMEDMRIKTMMTAQAMRDAGRISDEAFEDVRVRIGQVAANMDLYNVSFRTANTQAREHGRNWSTIQTMIGNAGKKFAGFSGLNVITDIFRQGADFFQNLDRNAVKIGKMTVLIGTAASSILHLAGGLAVVGQDLAAIGNIGILAPGFLTAMGIGIGVAYAALKDMKTVLEDLGPGFERLQDSISKNFWDQAAAPIREMVNGLMPTLTKQLNITATAMGGLFAEFANAFANGATESRVTGMFEKMNAAIDIFKGAIAPMVYAFITLGEVASNYFGRFAEWLVKLSEDFNIFIQAAAGDGRLDAWIERAIQGFKDVGTAIAGAVGIFNAIGDAARGAGIGGLGAFASALSNAAAIMNTPAFQNSLIMLFSGAAVAAREVGKAIYNLGPAIESFMPTLNLALVSIGQTMSTVIGYFGQMLSNPALQDGISNFVNGIKSGVESLAPALGPMGDSLGQIGTLLGQVAAQVGILVAAMAVNLSPVLDQITAAFGRITFTAGPEIVSIIQTLGAIMGPVVATLLPPLESLVTTVLPLISAGFAALAPIFPVLAAAFAPVVTAISDLVNMIGPFLIPAIGQIVAAMTPVIEVVGQVVGAIAGFLVPILGIVIIGVINNVVGVFQGMSNVFMAVVGIITALFTGFGAFFTKLFEGDIGGALNALMTMFGQIWDNIVRLVTGALQVLWNGVQLLFIGKLIGGIRTGLTQMGSIFTAVWNGIVSFLRGAMANISGTIMGGLNAVRGFFTAAWNGMLSIIRGAWNGITSAVSSGISGMMGFVSSIPGRISSALSGLRNLLVGAGRAIMDGLLAGLKAAWGAVTSFVGGIADWIAKNKGPIPYDRKLLQPAGEAIMWGLHHSLQEKFGKVMTLVDSMAGAIAGAFGADQNYIAGKNAADGLADGLLAGRATVAAAYSSLGTLPPLTSAGGQIGTFNRTVTDGRPSVASGGGMVLEHGAIQIVTPTKDPVLVAHKVLDEFAGYSNL